jgi:hypothetical protein
VSYGPDDQPFVDPLPAWHDDPEGGTYHLVVTARATNPDIAVSVTSPLHLDATVDGPSVDADIGRYAERMVWTHFSGEAGRIISLDDEATVGSWSGRSLYGPDGEFIKRVGWTRAAWRLPATGEYVLRSFGWDHLVGSVALSTAEQVEMPADGTPTTMAVDEPGEIVVAHADVPMGSQLTVTLDQVDPGFTDWSVAVHAPDGEWYFIFDKAGTSVPFAVDQPGGVYIVVGSYADATGSVRLSAEHFGAS